MSSLFSSNIYPKSSGFSCISSRNGAYKDQSIKSSERNRRKKVEEIETYITSTDQPLPIEMDRFWPVSKNKVAFQQVFIEWAIENVVNNQFKKQLFLGGSHKEGSELCFSVIDGIVKAERLLECAHEEADDRLLFHVNHAAKVVGFGSVAVASPLQSNISAN